MTLTRSPGAVLKLVLWLGVLELTRAQTEETTTTDDYGYSDNFTVDLSVFPELCSTQANRSFRRWFLPTFFGLICLAGLSGNVLVILTYLFFQRLRTMTDVYLLHLSFADLLLVLTLPLWAFNSVSAWALGLAVCKLMYATYKVTFYSGMFLLCSISVDRYFAISKAVTAHKHRARAVFISKVTSAAVWGLALVLSVPDVVFTNIVNNTCTPYSSTRDPLRVSLQTSQMLLAFLVPLLVMGFCYSHIVLTLRRTRGFERNRAVRVVLAVVAVFLVCQWPYNAVLFWTTVVAAGGGHTLCDHMSGEYYATDITQALAFLRCCLNPVVYAFIGVKFRRDVLKLLKDLGCLSQRRFFQFAGGSRKASLATDTETTTTTFSP